MKFQAIESPPIGETYSFIRVVDDGHAGRSIASIFKIALFQDHVKAIDASMLAGE